MEKETMQELLNVLACNYSNWMQGQSESAKKGIAAFWWGMFKDYDDKLMRQAVKNYVRISQFPPTIAGIQKEIEKMQPKSETTASMWNEVYWALSRASRFNEDDFKKLSKPVQQWFGGVSGVRQYQLMKADDLPYLQAYFKKTIPEEKDRLTAQRLMPPDVRRLLQPQEDLIEEY
jgi:hypothetical protein